LSNYWNGGLAQKFGYLHPSDLGLIGVVFNFGIFGLALFARQYLLYWRLINNIKIRLIDNSSAPFFYAALANLTLLITGSLVNGIFVLAPEHVIFFFVIVVCHYPESGGMLSRSA
jgi:hypothetical protein